MVSEGETGHFPLRFIQSVWSGGREMTVGMGAEAVRDRGNDENGKEFRKVRGKRFSIKRKRGKSYGRGASRYWVPRLSMG